MMNINNFLNEEPDDNYAPAPLDLEDTTDAPVNLNNVDEEQQQPARKYDATKIRLPIHPSACIVCRRCFHCSYLHGEIACNCAGIGLETPNRGYNLPSTMLDSRSIRFNFFDSSLHDFTIDWVKYRANDAYKPLYYAKAVEDNTISVCSTHHNEYLQARNAHFNVNNVKIKSDPKKLHPGNTLFNQYEAKRKVIKYPEEVFDYLCESSPPFNRRQLNRVKNKQGFYLIRLDNCKSYYFPKHSVTNKSPFPYINVAPPSKKDNKKKASTTETDGNSTTNTTTTADNNANDNTDTATDNATNNEADNTNVENDNTDRTTRETDNSTTHHNRNNSTITSSCSTNKNDKKRKDDGTNETPAVKKQKPGMGTLQSTRPEESLSLRLTGSSTFTTDQPSISVANQQLTITSVPESSTTPSTESSATTLAPESSTTENPVVVNNTVTAEDHDRIDVSIWNAPSLEHWVLAKSRHQEITSHRLHHLEEFIAADCLVVKKITLKKNEKIRSLYDFAIKKNEMSVTVPESMPSNWKFRCVKDWNFRVNLESDFTQFDSLVLENQQHIDLYIGYEEQQEDSNQNNSDNDDDQSNSNDSLNREPSTSQQHDSQSPNFQQDSYEPSTSSQQLNLRPSAFHPHFVSNQSDYQQPSSQSSYIHDHSSLTQLPTSIQHDLQLNLEQCDSYESNYPN